MINYDLEFLKELNEEFKSKPFKSTFPQYDHESQFEVAGKRLKRLSSLVELNGKKVLEIGCGRGHTSRRLADDYECVVSGIDVYESEMWGELKKNGNVDFRVADLSKDNPFEAGTFDLIISYAVWEHMEHPFTMLQECMKLLKPDGKVFLYANQYRSAIGSHLYRQLFFPYPHLLFSEDVINQYVVEDEGHFVVNKMTYSQYKEYFRILNVDVLHEKFYKRELDAEFYTRFYDKLKLYPKFDLELDFFEVILCKHGSNSSLKGNAVPCRYDLQFLKELNEEFRSKPFKTTFPQYDHDFQFATAEKRLKRLNSLVGGLKGKRVLEVGCGRGHICSKLASDYGCQAFGVDVYPYDMWSELKKDGQVEFSVADLSAQNTFKPGSFDLIISYAVWEHMAHPFAMLKECVKLLKPDGKLFIYANQYRSAIGSHLYRQIFFPYPHLLFSEEIINEYIGRTDRKYLLNKMTYSQYKEYFKLLDTVVLHERFYKREIDEEFYRRFEDKLQLYPRFDLELDFFEVVLGKTSGVFSKCRCTPISMRIRDFVAGRGKRFLSKYCGYNK